MTTNVTATNEANVREVERMMGKAMCAWANWQQAEAMDYTDPVFRHVSQREACAMHRSEYEATVRCIEMFVDDSIYEVSRIVIERAKEELGIEAA